MGHPFDKIPTVERVLDRHMFRDIINQNLEAISLQIIIHFNKETSGLAINLKKVFNSIPLQLEFDKCFDMIKDEAILELNRKGYTCEVNHVTLLIYLKASDAINNPVIRNANQL